MVFDRHTRSAIKDSIIIFAGVSSLVAVALGFLGLPSKVQAQEISIESLKEFRDVATLSLQALQKDSEYQKLQLNKIDQKLESILSYQQGKNKGG